jgi:hypothetical protein
MIKHNGIEVRARGIRRERSKDAGPFQMRGRKAAEPELPSKLTMARNATVATGQALKSRFKKVSGEEQARRLAICNDCEFFRASDSRCAKCGCQTNWKSRLAAWHCPIDKW